MVAVLIPVRNDISDYFFTIQLGDSIVRLGFRFNFRWSRWIMSIADELGNPLVDAIPLQFNTDLNLQFQQAGIPAGLFMLFDTLGGGEDYVQADLGTRAVLFWIPE